MGLILKAADSVWPVRNNLKFGETSPSLSNKQLRLKPRITEHYISDKNNIHSNHHHLFNILLQERLTLSAQENSQWLKTVKAAIKIQKKLPKQFIITHPKITSFSPLINVCYIEIILLKEKLRKI